MGKFRKKPVVIEAVRWDGDKEAMAEFLGGAAHCVIGDYKVSIHTLEGTMLAELGDWVIRGVKGEFYPCKPDIFAATYEPVDNNAISPLDLGSSDAEVKAKMKAVMDYIAKRHGLPGQMTPTTG